MKTLRETAISNIVWIITALISAGAFIATVKFQGEAIASTTLMISSDHERIVNIEKALVKVESMQEDLREIKYDVKEIRGIILRPAIGYNNGCEGTILSTLIKK